jgi:hypothetical protein
LWPKIGIVDRAACEARIPLVVIVIESPHLVQKQCEVLG